MCVRVSLRSIDGHFRFTSVPTALSKMVIKCIVLNNFSKVIYIFLLLLLSINTKLAYMFTTIYHHSGAVI